MHYHGTPITPVTALYELAGRHFCVSHAAPQDVARCHAIGQSVMLDNGAEMFPIIGEWHDIDLAMELVNAYRRGDLVMRDPASRFSQKETGDQ